MPLQPWPNDLEAILLAKSADKGAGSQPESLAQHTAQVLQRLADFMHLRPHLPQQTGQPRLWHCLYWAAFLHDFGKALPGFQAILRKNGDAELKSQWQGQRHEVFSLAFLDWLEDGLTEEEKLLTAAAIASHHRDAADIQTLYSRSEQENLGRHLEKWPHNHIQGLHDWLRASGWAWAQQLGLETLGVAQITIAPPPSATFAATAPDRIRYWLRQYKKFAEKLQWETRGETLVPLLALRGTLINADHSASAHASALPKLHLTAEDVLTSRQIPRQTLHQHQQTAEHTHGSALLTAPTGSGKTEAALLWAAGQIAAGYPAARLFYTLPYQASMNAMLRRLEETFAAPVGQPNLVGLQHGRALLALHQKLMERDEASLDSKEASRQAKWLQNLNQLNYPPVRVFSPYQMLKGIYRLRGYEAQLTDYHNGLFIFDEIHAYEIKRLALILKTIAYLRRHYNARFFIMSATFPQLIKQWLMEALGEETTLISATPRLFEAFQRHQLVVLNGELSHQLHLAEADARAGKSVLVVCNLVANAQHAYDDLVEKLAETDVVVMLLHGRFNLRDRLAKEEAIRQFTGVKSHYRQPVVLVATQVVEVSLDIDLDTIYTEPAPLEALVQRFGRVNRARRQTSCPVHVFNQPYDGQKIYDARLIEATLTIMERENGHVIAESGVGDWLDEIYHGEIAAEWQFQFDQIAHQFEDSILNSLRPFSADPLLQEKFGELFDGVDILPADLHNEYYDLVENKDFIEAQQLLVSISWGQYHALRGKGLIQKDDELKLSVAHVPYSAERGLARE